MGTIDQELNSYIWENFDTLKSIFSEKVYNILLKHKNENDKKNFYTTLEAVIEVDELLLSKIQNQYETVKIPNMSMDEISTALVMTPYDNFVDNKQYIDRALYFIDSYQKSDEKYSLLLHNLAGLYKSMEMYEKAEPLYLKSLNINEKLLGKRHPDTATVYNNLAGLYKLMELYKKAEPLYLKALKIQEKVLSKKHPDTATSYNNLAGLYDSMRMYEKAEPLYLKALKISEEVLGKEHPDTTITYNNINNFMKELNKVFFSNSKNSNLNFTIDKIEIENFKQYHKHFEMNFSPNINIIIGQNSIGKTTLLQAITLGLLKNDSPDEETSYSKYITKGEQSAEIVISHNNGNKKSVKVLKDKREIENNYFSPFVLTYGSNFFTDYRESDPIVQKMLEETIVEDFAHTIFLEHTDKFWNPLSILRNLAISKHPKAEEKKNIFINTLNGFLKVEEYELVPSKENDTRFHFIKSNNETTPLDLSELSEGYRGNVLLITDMLIKILGVGWTPKTIEGIVLIDEFDKHLHPKWQSKLVNKLTETFPNIQFIMTTHNPMSILDREADEITILREIDGGIEAIKKGGTQSMDVSGVLLEYFGVETVIGESLQIDLKKFTNLNIRNDLTEQESKELKELKHKLSKTVAVNFINDYKYFEYLRTKESPVLETKNIHSALDDLEDIL